MSAKAKTRKPKLNHQAVARAEQPSDRLQSILPEDSSRCDGSRTPPDTQYEIMWRHKEGMTLKDIANETHCDPRTVKAVIANWGTAPHTLRLQAHRPQVVDNLILGMHEAAKRGKLDSILNLSHTLGITQAPNSQQLSVGVQVVLNGGHVPSELSPAKPVANVEGSGETSSIQAQSSDVNITATISPSQTSTQHTQPQELTAHAGADAGSQVISHTTQGSEAAA